MPGLSARDEVLVAAANLAQGEPEREFTEWELTIEAWNLNRNRWGLRGFEQDHPDHKRVMMEIMGGGSLVREGLLVHTRKNRYKITAAGLARALSISAPRDLRRRNIYLYDSLKDFVFNRVFEAHLVDPEEPRTWLGVASFLRLTKNDPELLEAQLAQVRSNIASCRRFMEEEGRSELRRGDAERSITRERLDRLASFIDLLEDRFRPQMDAIRQKKH